MKNENALQNLLIKTSLRAASKQHNNGSFDAGCNGPYKHSETPVRNTAHWLSLFCYALGTNKLNLQRRTHLEEASRKAVNYLCQIIHVQIRKVFFVDLQ